MIDFGGMTKNKCPNACKVDRCIISTIALCRHPLKGGGEADGPITSANKAAALAYLGISVGDKISIEELGAA